ncbi:MAG: glycosyl hydrolase, partial [Gammaproteobacteria bacterium]|nr:glycosyl hydrolase [Gammaproteobacteria bacterium]
MIELRNRRILIDGIPRLLMAGEIHYFRLQRDEWQDRIDKLKRCGCNTVASYIPWLCHETRRRDIDLSGRIRPELDLGAFIDLCRDSGLWFIARPGPYVMAELKNEGLPYWLFERYPELVSIGWDGRRSDYPIVDYLAPAFLEETAHWYRAVMAVIVPRLQPHGGNVIAIQLDNEIGMLSWLTNTPELGDAALAGFREWLHALGVGQAAGQRHYLPLDDELAFRSGVRTPDEAHAARLMQDLGRFLRWRYARYAEALQQRAEAAGAAGVPFIINVHGSVGGRGVTFPIGISQLRDTYAGRPGFMAGSDLYLGNLTPENFQDLYVCNAFLQATCGPDQPLAALEFECGDGDSGGKYGYRYAPSAADFKTRMCIAQGHRLINYYLFTGGYNYRLDPAPDDGDGRIAITGERHGIAAPVGPEGQLNYTFPALRETTRAMMAVAEKLAVMDEEHDAVSLGFIPDYYMTECTYTRSAVMKAIAGNVETNRGHGPWEVMVRALLLRGYRFGAVDVQHDALSVERTPVLALPSARHMAEPVQRKLVDWITAGGSILLYGELPLLDME